MRRIAATLVLLTVGCAGPIPELWPPTPGAPAHHVIVSLDDWHAMVALPPEKEPAGPPIRYEEWGYAELGWYLEDRQGFLGVLRVLFWFPPGVVEVGTYDRAWADRSPTPPTDRFLFRVGEEGLTRLRRHLQSTIGSLDPVKVTDGSRFFPSARSYNLLVHQCHQYAARALREAGLPVTPFLAISRAAFAAQLRRAVRMAEETESGGQTEPAM